MINKLEKFENLLKERNNNKRFKDTLITILLKAENPYLKEKRKRLQMYEALDLYLSLETKLDFFTIDSINIISRTKIIPFVLEKNTLTSDMVIYGFFGKNSLKFLKFFKDVNFSKMDVKRYLGNKWAKPLTKNEFLQYKVLSYLKYIKFKFENLFFNSINPLNYFNNSIKSIDDIVYSPELKKILNNVVKKARFNYRTPIICSSSLFLGLLEEKGSYSRKLFKKLIPNLKSFLTLRYKILSQIYKTNVYIHTMVEKNRLFYIFYAQLALPEREFQKLINHPMRLQSYTMRLRNRLIEKGLCYDYNKYLKYLTYNNFYSDSLEIQKLRKKTKEKKKMSFLDKLIYYTVNV